MERLSKSLNVAFINKTFFPDYKDVKVINQGECFLWAYIAFQLYEGVQLWTFGSHAFVKYKGKFYDSERPRGVKDWKDLPATNFGQGCGCWACSKPARRQTVNAFKKPGSWGGSAKRFGVKWSDVRKQVQRVIDEK